MCDFIEQGFRNHGHPAEFFSGFLHLFLDQQPTSHGINFHKGVAQGFYIVLGLLEG